MLPKHATTAIILAFNFLMLLIFVYRQQRIKDNQVKTEQRFRVRLKYNFNDLIPAIDYEQTDPSKPHLPTQTRHKGASNCIQAKAQTAKQRLHSLKLCLPLFREHTPKKSRLSQSYIKDIPNYVAKYGEAGAVKMNYPFDTVKWGELHSDTFQSVNIVHKLGFYDHPIPADLYDDNPAQFPDYETPHYGIFNNDDYCHIHDVLIQHDPDLALKRKYFVTDYHHLGLPRLFVMNQIGEDLMPKISKNMPRINFYQKLYPIDLRANLFYFKVSSFHYNHLSGRHFNCFGQSYNHIPGHGALIRKDLLNEFTKKWVATLSQKPKCREQMDFFLSGHRLYEEAECKDFFKYIAGPEYAAKKRLSPYQFIIKIGYGVHRGEGVYLFDGTFEDEIKQQYGHGKLCGKVQDNILAQTYVDNPLLFKGHKFDFRIYMLISSVDPFRVYYHDGFLRVSLFPFSKHSTENGAQITNTEKAKTLIKKLKRNNETHLNMTIPELMEFQMQSLEQLGDYLHQTGKVNDPAWTNNFLRLQFKRAFMSLAKMIQKRVYKSPNLFESFGVDFVIDEHMKVSVIEVNASPMIVGTNKRKTELMKGLLTGLFNITYAQQFSRTGRALEFIEENKEAIRKAEGNDLKQFQAVFEKLYKNDIEDEFKEGLKNNPWKLVYDESLQGRNKYVGLVSDDCADFLEGL